MEESLAPPEFGVVLLSFYECLTDPDQLDSLMVMITSWLDDENGQLVSPQLDHHAEHAWKLLGEISEQDYQSSADFEALKVSRYDDACAVVAAIADQIRPEDQSRLNDWLAEFATETALLLRVVEDAATELVILSRDPVNGHFLVKQTGPDFQALISKFVADSFELTHAEFMLVQELLQGGTLREIADRLGKSWETTRSQVKSLTNKLGVNSQADILRIVNQAASLMPVQKPATAAINASPVKSLRRPDGRTIVYEVDGPPSEKTLVFIHGAIQGRHWPDKARVYAQERGWRLVRISRAGRGGSSLNLKENKPLLQDHCDDLIAVMNNEGIDAFSIFAAADGFAVGYHAALQHPDRIGTIVGLEIIQPILSRQVIDGFAGKMKTYGLACLYAPKTVRYIYGLAMHKLRRMEDRYKGTHPLIGLEMAKFEDEDGIRADDRNYQDLMVHRAEGVWRDASYSCYDWAYAPQNANIRPRAAIIHSGNSMVKYPGTLEAFAQRIRASVYHIDCYMPYVSAALPTVLDAIENR